MRLIRLLVLAAAVVSPARAWAQITPQAAQSLQDGLAAAIGVLLPGYADPADTPMRITQDDAAVAQVELPLKGAQIPLKATLQPDSGGAWFVTAMTLPPKGTLATETGVSKHYAIGRQSISGRLDPTFATASSGAATLDDVRIVADHGSGQMVQTIGRSTVRAELLPQADGLLDLHTDTTATALAFTARQPTRSVTVRVASGRMKGDIFGLDPAHAGALRNQYRAFQAMLGGAGAPAMRNRARALLQALPGTLDHLTLDQTASGIAVQLPNLAPLLIGREQMTAAAAARDDKVDATLLIDLDGLSVPGIPAAFADLSPHRLRMQPVLTGLPAEPLMALLRDALAPNADQAALNQRLLALLRAPGALAEIQSISLDAGPVAIQGSARLRMTDSGKPGGEAHLRARGMDALMTQLQGKPQFQQLTFGLLLLEGLGHPDGDALVWDITFGDGPPTINGVPMP